MTSAPAAIGDPFISYYTIVDNLGDIYGQLHFIWRANGGEIWDAWQDLPMVPGQPSGRG